MTPYNSKPIPRSILIFGAAGHIGKPLAQFLRREAPHIRLRLVSTDELRCAALRAEFPQAEVVQANYFDLASLEPAVEGIEGLFVNTPGGTDERLAMTNLVSAVKRANCAVHILRTLGMQPESNLRRQPESITRPPALGLPVQHPIAKQALDESGLPVTYLNFGATFMDNFFWMTEALRRERKLVWHNRLVPFIDPRDIAEVAGRLFLSDNHRHIGQFHTLNNGQDLIRFADVASLMTEVFGEKVTHDGSKDAFFAEYEEIGDLREVLWEFFDYEQDNEVVWALNDFVERTLGRRPTSVREWLREHKRELLGAKQATASAAPTATVEPAAALRPASALGAAIGEEIWECTISTPVGKMPHELVVRRALDDTWSGSMRDLMSGAELPVRDGRIAGDVMTWASELTNPFKMKLKIEVRILGNELSGQASAGMLGKSSITGTRRS